MIKTAMLCAALALAIGGCKKDEGAGQSNDQKAQKTPRTEAAAPATIDVDTLATLVAAKKAAVFDANGESTRAKYGKIPGATLLSSYKSYELSELPADKASKLVFYCANTRCGASHAAAKRAIAAGYGDVSVLPAGIQGWTEAGKQTEKVN